jgi:hypothetical protein
VSAELIVTLGGVGFLLALLSVLIDRLNFPQPRFRARTVVYDRRGPHRDRTGAHIVNEVPERRRRLGRRRRPPGQAAPDHRPG